MKDNFLGPSIRQLTLGLGTLNLESRSVVLSLIVSIFPLVFIVFYFISSLLIVMIKVV